MSRKNQIQNAYHYLGKEATFYDGMMTCSTGLGKLVCQVVWNMNKEKNVRYIELATKGIPEDFAGRLLEVPIGTGVLTLPIYKDLNQAKIIALDYSDEMMATAKKRAEQMKIQHVEFMQGDVGKLPFEDGSFDAVLSMNGFHAFPNKVDAYLEIHRVLKKNGVFCGCFYIKGENKRTDWFISHIYKPLGFFTPPFQTKEEVKIYLETLYSEVQIDCVESMICFRCVK